MRADKTEHVAITMAMDDAVEDAAKRLQDAGMRHTSTKAENAERGPWFRFQNRADDDTTVQIDIYDEIDWLWGVTSRDFRDQLKALPESVETIDLHINSPGGDVYEAIAIMNSLRQHDARVVTTVDGLAASSAGFIAVGASDELIVAENAEIMAHLPWAIMVGDAADMRKMADDLDRIGKNIASIFVAKAGGELDDWVAILTAETWWSADESVEAGIADKVLKSPKRDAKESAKNRFNLSVFNHAGRSNAPAPRIPQAHNQTPLPVEAEGNQGKEPHVATLSESARESLGLDAEADDDATNAAIIALAEKAKGSESTPDTPAEPTAEQLGQVAAKYGAVVVDKTVHDKLVSDAAAGAEARAQQIREANEATVQNALSRGQITPASADTWRNSLAQNRDGALALLATIPENKALPVDEIGHGVSNEASHADVEMAGAFAQITGRTYGQES